MNVVNVNTLNHFGVLYFAYISVRFYLLIAFSYIASYYSQCSILIVNILYFK